MKGDWYTKSLEVDNSVAATTLITSGSRLFVQGALTIDSSCIIHNDGGDGDDGANAANSDNSTSGYGAGGATSPTKPGSGGPGNALAAGGDGALGSRGGNPDTSADGGGLIVKGASDKQITWTDATDAWTLTEHLDIPSAKEYRVGNVLVAKNGEIGPTSGTWKLNAGVAAADADIFTYNGTGAIKVPVGDDSERPTGGSEALGQIRFSTQDSANVFEGYNGTAWTKIGGAATVSSGAPSSQSQGDLWYDSDDGRLFIYYNDGNTSQWVDASPNGVPTDLTVEGFTNLKGNLVVGDVPPWTVTGGNYTNVSISGADASSSGFLWLGNGAATSNADFDLGRINYLNGSTIVAQIKGTTQTGANDDGRISFFTKETGQTITERLRISSVGNITPGADATQDLGSASLRFANIYSADLQLSNEGGANDVDGTWGQYTIQEGEEDLFLINRRSGKKYKFMLQEVN